MKFKVMSDSLQAMGNLVLNGFIKDSHSNVAFKVEDDKMTLLCYSSSTYFKGSIDAKDCEDCNGDWKVVDGLNFKSILSVLPDEEKEISFTSDTLASSFVLRYGKSKVNLKTRMGDMIREENNFQEIAEVDAVSFFKTLNDILKVVENDNIDSGGPTKCLHLCFHSDSIVFMGTNKIALAETIYPIDNLIDDELEDEYILLSGVEARLLSRQMHNNETLKLIKTDSKFGLLDSRDTMTLVGVMDEVPINYQAIKTSIVKEDGDDGFNKVSINAHSLKSALTNIIKLSPGYPSAIFHFGENGLILENDSGDIFEVLSDYEKEEDIAFGLNKIALQSLFSLWTDEIKLVFGDEPADSILQFILTKNVEGEMEEEENIFIGVASDNE